MDKEILISNLTNPTLLYFLLGVVATTLKSDLEIPGTTSKFISLYLLFSIGFKGGRSWHMATLTSKFYWQFYLVWQLRHSFRCTHFSFSNAGSALAMPVLLLQPMAR